jgi:hypothetical protein
VAVLEDQHAHAERRSRREQVRQHARERDQRRLQRDEEQQEAEPEDDEEDGQGLRGERRLEVVVLRRRASEEGTGG